MGCSRRWREIVVALALAAAGGCGVAGARSGECAKDDDCVGATCCHPARCVPRSRAQPCGAHPDAAAAAAVG